MKLNPLKIVNYCDLQLHATIIKGMIAVWKCRNRGYHFAVPSGVQYSKTQSESLIKKLKSYCSLWFTIRQRIGFKDTCFYRSALLCRILRISGIDAHIHFGTMKADDTPTSLWHTNGHCWVSCNNESIETEYSFVFKYPLEE
jgi:Transglutaminase-like superfamily